MLTFSGTGSAFYSQLGNTGAFIKKGRELFLIDCGSSTFAKLQSSSLLKDIDHIYVLMTHLHPDHAGSLGDLVFYGYYAMGTIGQPSVTVMAPSGIEVRSFLRSTGVISDFYSYIELDTHKPTTTPSKQLPVAIETVSVQHVPYLTCFGYVLSFEGESVYYSGDSNMIPTNILKRFLDGEFTRFYQDTCLAEYPGNVHFPLSALEAAIPLRLRERVTCMHLDTNELVAKAEALGFRVAIAARL